MTRTRETDDGTWERRADDVWVLTDPVPGLAEAEADPEPNDVVDLAARVEKLETDRTR